MIEKPAALIKEIKGGFPVVFSPEGELKWAFTEKGTLLEIDYQTGEHKELAQEICPHCQYVFTEFPFPIMEMVGQYKNQVHYDLLDHQIVRLCNMEELDVKAQIAGCARYGEKLILIATYADQRETTLLEYHFNHAVKLFGLKFPYKLACALAVSQYHGLAACLYGEKGKEIAIYDLKHNQLINILKGHEVCIQALCFVDGADRLVSGDQFGILKFWCISTGELIDSMVLKCHNINAILFSPKHFALFVLGSRPGKETTGTGKYIMPVSESVLFVWNMNHPGIPNEVVIGSKDEYANSLAISPDEETLITGEIYQYFMSGEEKSPVLKCWSVKDILPA